MNNEEKILSMLETLNTKVELIAHEQADMKHELAYMKHELADMKHTLNAVFEHTALLTERQTSSELSIRDLSAITKENAMDILRLKAAR